MDNLNPSWTTPFQIAYHFEQVQKLRFAVYDHDGHSRTLDQHDFLGEYKV